MSVTRKYMSFRERVHSARAMYVHYAYAPLLSGNFELATRNLVHDTIQRVLFDGA